jgi:hypothetical protein
MSIQTVEIALPTGIDSVSVGLAEPISIVEVRQGAGGPAGATGPAGPNTLTTATTTNLTGFISGNGTNIAGATAAATTATANTLVLRSAGGGASFAGLNTNSGSYAQIGGENFNVATTSNANLTTTGSGTVIVSGAGGTTISGGTLTFSPSGFAYGAGAASAHRTALGLGTGDSPTFAGLNAVGNGVTTTTLGADGRQSWFLNNSGVAAGQISYSTPNAEPGILIIKGTGRSDIRAVAGMGIAIASYSSGSGAPAEQFRFSLAGNMLVGTTSETGLTSGGLRTLGNAIIGGTLAIGNGAGSADLILARDAANTLAQRNGDAQQESRIYGTYTGAGNYRRLALKMSSAGVAQIVAEGGGSGALGNRIEIDGLRIGKGGGNVATNTALGASALNANTTGNDNSAVGQDALFSNTTGNDNSAVGYFSLRNNTTGSSNSAVGFAALQNNTTGNSNSAVGFLSLRNNTTGNNNSAVGYFSLTNNTTGGNNSAVGFAALQDNTTGNNNSAVGISALLSNTTGSSNSAVGRNAGRFIADGTTLNTVTNNSVYLGADTKALASNQTNQIVIGHNATGIGSNTAVLGNDSIETTALKGNVGIGTTSPSALLDVNSDTVRVRTARTPASAAAAGNAGDICWDADYIYVCTATNTWKRAAISTW